MKRQITPRQVWETALGQLQIQVTKANYLTFLKDTQGLSYDGRLFVVQVNNAFAREYLGKRLTSLIIRILSGILKQEVEVKFQEIPGTAGGSEAGAEAESPRQGNGANPLNPKYTFSTFVVGQGNRLAHAAALGVAEAPGKSYNPLFIYGGTGLGKTHLLHAIGHLTRARNQDILYVTAEQFTNDFIQAIRERKTEEFRARYRQVNLLLDDIQFLMGKEQTQEGLFHTFNDLHNANRQIAFSSDRPPKSLPFIEERLRSRFEWGLIADIQPPDLETRQAILTSKAEGQGITLPHAVVDLLARKVRRNVRELEGTLNRVLAYAQLTGAPLTPELATQALAEIPGEERRRDLTSDQVLMTLAEYYKLEIPRLLSARRDQPLAKVRQIAMYLMREELGLTLSEIGQVLGGRDHKTVHHGFHHIASSLNDDLQLRQEILELNERLAALPLTSPQPNSKRHKMGDNSPSLGGKSEALGITPGI